MVGCEAKERGMQYLKRREKLGETAFRVFKITAQDTQYSIDENMVDNNMLNDCTFQRKCRQGFHQLHRDVNYSTQRCPRTSHQC